MPKSIVLPNPTGEFVKKALLLLLASFMLASYAVSCSSRDDRDDIRARNGDPDDTLTLGKDQFWRETWFYYDVILIDGLSAGVAYEFRKSSGCGVIEDVYLFTQYPVNNPSSDSTASRIILPKTGSRNPFSPY